ncbi:amino acid adenylation domain-containing protein, partial [Nocardia farcinica]|uniref:amino acid adenylation domain-containing protein n=1 Tax=Nocardia farcinica TaxID=37329 RepID=UPI002454F7FD
MGPGDHVALATGRSAEFMIGLWAVAHTGAAFVPIDTRNPARRVAHMVEQAGIRVALTTAAARDLLPDTVRRLVLDDPRTSTALDDYPATPLTARDRVRTPHPRDLAYVLYTSGSTGAPKGVAVTHEGLADFTAEQRARFAVDPTARVLQAAAPGFDALVLEVLLAHANGAALVVPPPEVYAGPQLAEFIRAQRISHAFLTPSVLATMSPDHMDSLRVLAAGGEAVTAETVDRWAPGRWLLNGYGPTETTIFACQSAPLRPGGPVTIGTPVRGVRALVLDTRLRPVPVGVPGELYLAGAQLARGYLGRPAATACAFVADPFHPGGRLYRTGDLARWTHEHTLEYLGRRDFQVKIRGQRIELGEIENALACCPGVDRAAVLLIADDRGVHRLAAYLSGGPGLDPAEGRAPGGGPGASLARSLLSGGAGGSRVLGGGGGGWLPTARTTDVRAGCCRIRRPTGGCANAS